MLCGSLAFLQYRWIGEVSAAERERLQKDLSGRLEAFRIAFSERIDGQVRILSPSTEEMEDNGREAAYSAQLQRWHRSGTPLFSRVALAVPEGGPGNADVALLLPDAAYRFMPAAWPAEWQGERENLLARLWGPGFGRMGGRGPGSDTGLIEVPRFDSRPDTGPGREAGRGRGPGPRREREWLIVELNRDYIRTTLGPELTNRFLSDGDYDAAILDHDRKSVIYESASAARIAAAPDAEGALAAMIGSPDAPRGRGPGGPPRMEPPGGNSHSWIVIARHRAGSLEAIVEAARRRNIAASTGMLLLIVAIVALLLRLSRQKEQLAAMQMNFVTGVSHELRTPLTVIRTAAFNLRGKISQSPEQVERYGKLIESQARTLTELVDQVLLYARSGVATPAGIRTSVTVAELIDAALKASLGDSGACEIEKSVEPGLPRVSVDAGALTQALRNLIENAVKYAGLHTWIGIRAFATDKQVAITVADRGPGIPDGERDHIFEAFFRGKRALDEQIHGTGLGLNLAQTIVAANGGTIHVRSGSPSGCEFTIMLPAAAETAVAGEITHAAYSAR